MDKAFILFFVVLFIMICILNIVFVYAVHDIYHKYYNEKEFTTEYGIVTGLDTSKYKEGDIFVVGKSGNFEILNDIKYNFDYALLMVYNDNIKININQQVTCQEVFLEEDVKLGDCLYISDTSNPGYTNATKLNFHWGVAETNGKKGDQIFMRIIKPKDIVNF